MPRDMGLLPAPVGLEEKPELIRYLDVNFKRIEAYLRGEYLFSADPGVGGGLELSPGLEIYNPSNTPYIDFHNASGPAADGNLDYRWRISIPSDGNTIIFTHSSSPNPKFQFWFDGNLHATAIGLDPNGALSADNPWNTGIRINTVVGGVQQGLHFNNVLNDKKIILWDPEYFMGVRAGTFLFGSGEIYEFLRGGGATPRLAINDMQLLFRTPGDFAHRIYFDSLIDGLRIRGNGGVGLTVGPDGSTRFLNVGLEWCVISNESRVPGNGAAVQINTRGDCAWGHVLRLQTAVAGIDAPKILFRRNFPAKHYSIGILNGTDDFVITEDGGDGLLGSGEGAIRVRLFSGNEFVVYSSVEGEHAGQAWPDSAIQARSTGNNDVSVAWHAPGARASTMWLGTDNIFRLMTDVGTFPRFDCDVNDVSSARYKDILEPWGPGAMSKDELTKRKSRNKEIRRKVHQVHPVKFRYKSPDPELIQKSIDNGFDPIEVQKNIDYHTREQFGLIAENVAEVFPEVVGRDAEGRPDAVKYSILVSHLFAAMQDQDEEIAELREMIEGLKGGQAGLKN